MFNRRNISIMAGGAVVLLALLSGFFWRRSDIAHRTGDTEIGKMTAAQAQAYEKDIEVIAASGNATGTGITGDVNFDKAIFAITFLDKKCHENSEAIARQSVLWLQKLQAQGHETNMTEVLKQLDGEVIMVGAPQFYFSDAIDTYGQSRLDGKSHDEALSLARARTYKTAG